MGWRGWGGAWGGLWPGRGPFSYLPPWQRPGWLYGYGRWGGYGFYRGYSPYTYARFPWPRLWPSPGFRYSWPYPPAPDPEFELSRLEAEKEVLLREIEEMKEHIAEGTTPAVWPRTMAAAYGFPQITSPSPEGEKELLEQQSSFLSSQIQTVRKRLEELEKEG